MESKKQISIKDVAKEANVGIATVDRVLNNRTGVSNKTKEKVLSAIKKLNYQPNIMASNLALKKTFTFAILLPGLTNKSTYWDLVNTGIEKAQLELEKYAIKLLPFHYERTSLESYRNEVLKIINNKIDGLILTPKFPGETKLLLQDCYNKNIPFIFIDSTISDEKPLCNIGQPLYESGQLAANLFNYCFDAGTILIAYIRDQMDDDSVIDTKTKGLIDFLADENPKINTKQITIDNSMKDGREENIAAQIKNKLANDANIKGIFIPNSKKTTIAKFLEKETENKIYLIGYDLLEEDKPYIEKGIIDFTICQNPGEQGYKAMNKLFEYLVLRKEVEDKITMPLDVISRINYLFY